MTPEIHDYTSLILNYAKQVDGFAVAGGDGTLNLALEGLILSEKPVLVLPLGTANNLARNLQIPTDLRQACQVLNAGKIRSVDVAKVNGIYFLNVAGLGLSTQISRRIEPKAKRYFGVLAYIYYAWKVARRMTPFSVWIRSEGREVKIKALQVSVCNGRFYGSGLVAAEGASISDGLLDLIGTQVDAWWKGLQLIPALIKGKHQLKEEILSLRGSSFQLRTRHPMRLDVDGDIKTQTPANFEMHSRKLKVLVPS